MKIFVVISLNLFLFSSNNFLGQNKYMSYENNKIFYDGKPITIKQARLIGNINGFSEVDYFFAKKKILLNAGKDMLYSACFYYFIGAYSAIITLDEFQIYPPKLNAASILTPVCAIRRILNRRKQRKIRANAGVIAYNQFIDNLSK